MDTSEPTPMKNRTTVERKSERELIVTRTFDGPARLVFEGVDQARAAETLVGAEVDRHVPAFLRGGCSRRGQVPFRVRSRDLLKAYGVLREVHRSDAATRASSGPTRRVTTAPSPWWPSRKKTARRCWSCTNSIPRRKPSTPPSPGWRVGCPRRSRNWTSFSSPWSRARDENEVGRCRGRPPPLFTLRKGTPTIGPRRPNQGRDALDAPRGDAGKNDMLTSESLNTGERWQASAITTGQPTLRLCSTFRATGQSPRLVEPHVATPGLSPHVSCLGMSFLKAGYVKKKIVGCLRSCHGIQSNYAGCDNLGLVDVALLFPLSLGNTFVLAASRY